MPNYLPKPIKQKVSQQKKSPHIFIGLNQSTLTKPLARQMSCFGYSSRIFTQSDDLYRALTKDVPDIIIMEVGFSEGDLSGAHLMAMHQANLETPIPVIFISDRDDLEARLASVRANGQAFMTLPVDLAHIIEKLDELTSNKMPEPYRILIVEDSRTQAHYIDNILRTSNMITQVVREPLTLMQTLVAFRPELIIMDVYLPDCNGVELARVIRQQEAYVSVPIVFLSTEQALHRQLNALMLGGDDFLTKPIAPEHLTMAIHSRAHRARILRMLMIRDSLTNLLNHTYTLEQLDIEVSRANRSKEPICFAMLDIDHFKQVNDNYGHPVGDKIIKSLSHLLQQRLRKSDTVGRYGGEEFAIILPNTDIKTAFQLIEEIRMSFASLTHWSLDQDFNVTLSAGIARHTKNMDTNKLTEIADQALYHAKHHGRNQVIIAQDAAQ